MGILGGGGGGGGKFSQVGLKAETKFDPVRPILGWEECVCQTWYDSLSTQHIRRHTYVRTHTYL